MTQQGKERYNSGVPFSYMKRVKFNCTSCGECCKNLAATIEYIKNDIPHGLPGVDLAALVEKFPYKTDEAGACEMLVDNKCSVYKDRPVFCNYKKAYERYPEAASSIEDWYSRMMSNCNFLIAITQRPKEFIVSEPYILDHDE